MNFRVLLIAFIVMTSLSGCQTAPRTEWESFSFEEKKEAKGFKSITDLFGEYHLISAKKKKQKFTPILNNSDKKGKLNYTPHQSTTEFVPINQTALNWNEKIIFDHIHLNASKNGLGYALNERIESFATTTENNKNLTRENFQTLIVKETKQENGYPIKFARFQYINHPNKVDFYTYVIIYLEGKRITTMQYIKKDKPLTKQEIQNFNKIIYFSKNKITQELG